MAALLRGEEAAYHVAQVPERHAVEQVAELLGFAVHSRQDHVHEVLPNDDGASEARLRLEHAYSDAIETAAFLEATDNAAAGDVLGPRLP